MLHDLSFRLRSLFKRSIVEQELDDELRAHFDHLVEAHLSRGLARDAAIRRARLEFGGLDQIKEEHRDARGIGFIEVIMRDFRHALRQARRSPGFSLMAVVCLGFGIGVNTAIFGVINAVVLRPMPVAEPDRLLMVSRGNGEPFSYPTYLAFRNRASLMSGIVAAVPMESDLDVDGNSNIAVAEVVSANYAEVMGIRMSVGRWFTDDRDPAAVISHAVWENRFKLSPDVIGHTIRSEAQTYTIVGVAPAEFGGVFAPMRTDIWVPVQTRPRLAEQLEEGKAFGLLLIFGRLRDGVTAAQASAELNAIDTHLWGERGALDQRPSPIVAEEVRGLPNRGGRSLKRVLTTLLGAVVGVVLLIACVNVGHLLLARGALRQRELAVRVALGASRWRLLQQLLTETLVLALGGAIFGVVLAVWTNRLLQATFPAFVAVFALHVDLSLDWRALVFTIIIALVATVLCGLLPASRASRLRIGAAFKNEIAGGNLRRRPVGLVAQVVMSLVLLFVAGSFLQGLAQLQATDPGFEVTGRLYAHTALPSSEADVDRRRLFYSQVLERLRAIPGVQSAALTLVLPLIPAGSDCVSVRDVPEIKATASDVGTGYFETLGINLVEGHDFAPDELHAGTVASVIVNQSLARLAWRERSPVGQRVMVGCEAPEPAIVVAVASDSAIRAVGEIPKPHLYRRIMRKAGGGFATILVAADRDPATMVQPIRQALLAMGQGIRVYEVRPLSIQVEQSYAAVRWLTTVLAVFGVLALLLASVGLYGSIAYRVALRTQEIGVRMALGARRSDVFREVLTHGLVIVLTGVVIGEVLTAALTGVAGSTLEGVGRTSPSIHVAIGVIWVAVALAACYLPAARAARVDPLVALRHE